MAMDDWPQVVRATERLVLRPWSDEDAEELYGLARDPRVGEPAGWPAHGSVAESRQIIRDVLSDAYIFAIFEKAGASATAGPCDASRLVGCAGLTPSQHVDAAGQTEMELGYWLGVPFWGRGYMTEAARELVRFGFGEAGLTAIWACHFDGNDRSRRVMGRLGMEYHHSLTRSDGGQDDGRLEHVYVIRRP